MQQELIKIIGLTKKYGENTALRNINLVINKGEVIGILGPNGAGKTTLISILSALRCPSEGKVKINDLDISKDKHEIKRMLGIVFQESSLDKTLTVKENLLLHAYLFELGKPEAVESVDQTIKDFKLGGLQDRIVKTLSGGERQRVEIAKCLVHKPKIFVFDEPTVGIDPEIRIEIWEKIKLILENKDNTVLITSHYLEEIEKLCDRIVMLDKGKIVLDDQISKLKGSFAASMEVSFRMPCKKEKLEEILGFSVSGSGAKYSFDLRKAGSINSFVEKLSKHGLELETIETKKQSLESIYLKIIGDKQ